MIYTLGPIGSHSYFAARKYFKNKQQEIKLKGSFSDIYKSMEGEDYAIVPLENSIGGDVNDNLMQIYSLDYLIIGELFLKISHNFIFHKNSSPANIKKIYLHPQVKLQCSEWLDRNPNLAIQLVNSTSTGAQLISNNNEPDSATIASLDCAKEFDLLVQEKNVGNFEKNFTRFIVIKKGNTSDLKTKLEIKETEEGIKLKKYTIICELEHRENSLLELLTSLSELKVNLTKIESQHIPSNPWNYRFLIDFTSKAVLSETDLYKISTSCHKFNLIGVYKPGLIFAET